MLFTPSQTIRDFWQSSTEEVFTATISDGMGRRWRGATYDSFDGRQWQQLDRQSTMVDRRRRRLPRRPPEAVDAGQRLEGSHSHGRPGRFRRRRLRLAGRGVSASTNRRAGDERAPAARSSRPSCRTASSRACRTRSGRCAPDDGRWRADGERAGGGGHEYPTGSRAISTSGPDRSATSSSRRRSRSSTALPARPSAIRTTSP